MNRNCNKNQGFVLVIVLWVLAILSVVTLGIGRQAWLDRQAAAYSLDHTLALMQARGAVNRGVVELRNKSLKDLSALQSGQVPGSFPATFMGQQWAQPLDLLKESEYFSDMGAEFANDIVEFRIVDLESKFNINTIPVSFMEEIEGLSRPTIRKIEFRRTGDPEDGVPPMMFHTIEELRYVDGVDDEAWFGEDDEPGLPEYLTVWGDAKVNINTATPETLAIIPDLESRDREAILSFRVGDDGELFTNDDRGFADFNVVWQQTGIEGEKRATLQNLLKLDSNYFEITGIATRRGGKVRAKVSAIVDMGSIMSVQFRDPGVQTPIPPYVRWREETLGS